MKTRVLIVSVLVLIMCIVSVGADYPQRLNVSMKEVVFNNITFARDFDLEEENPYCHIEGTLNVSNVYNDTIFDIYLSFTNVNRMTSDFVWSAGRMGEMYSGGASLLEIIPDSVNISDTYNNYTLSLDLDNDGNTDYMWVNSTDIVFNLSTDGIINLTLRNGGANAPIGAGNIPQTLAMDQVPIVGSRTYGTISVNGTTNIADSLYGNETDISINELYESPMVIHIPELRKGNYSLFRYNVTCTDTDPPININTTYSNSLHPSVNKKVLAGYNWTVTQWAINDFYLSVPITNVNITIIAQTVEWNSSEFNFSLATLLPLGDWSNVSGNGTSNTTWHWVPNGGTLNPGDIVNISYNVTAPMSVPFAATYLALIENLTYDAPFLMSNLTIIHLNASADINSSFEKRIDRPARNVDDHNVTWEIRPSIIVPLNISYQLNKVTMWVTHNLDPNNYTGLNKTLTGSPLDEINLSHGWDGASNYWYFNYTDGANASYPPPIIWLKPEWLINNKFGQIMNYSRTVNGNDLYLKYIYVVHGYWLEVSKNISSVGEGQYKIHVFVENIGNGWTPQYEFVTVYDFVPNEFTPWNFDNTVQMINESVGVSGSDFYGTAFRWNIPWKRDLNSSLGPSRGPDAVGYDESTWNVTYYVNGTGDYRASELYIVGLDPLKVDGAFTSPVISVISGLQSYSKELIYISIFVFLIVLNVTNLVMTNRINRKLDEAGYKHNSQPGHHHRK